MSDNPIYSDFWLDQEKYSDFVDPSPENKDKAFSIDLIKLSSVRRIISNYVDILTGASVPVFFRAIGDSANYGGKEIYISTAIKRRKDFDQAVGLALHEAAHTVLTDFDVAKVLGFNVPKHIWDFCDKHKIRRLEMEAFIKTMFNIVEDWYIDDWVISRVPGYIGYYEASYNDIFNTSTIDQLIISNEFRYPSLASYKFRVINFCNPLTDLQALPGLEEIADIVGISTISRLSTTKDRIKVAYKIIDVVLKHLEDFHTKFNPQTSQGNQSQKSRININDFFGDQKGKSKSPDKSPDKSDTDRTIQDVADQLGNRPKTDDHNKQMASQISKSPDKQLPKDVQKELETQIHYINGDVKKAELNPQQKTMLDLIEKHGIVLVYVPVPVAEGNEEALKIGCIVVKKLSMELIEAGDDLFPMAKRFKDENEQYHPKAETDEAVRKGLLLGSKLGKRLLIRREINQDKTIRKRRGKINKRLLYSAGCDAEDIFQIIRQIKYNKGSLHITVDASTSMTGDKWSRTMTMCVAICKATSMIDNVHVTVSFRATKTAKGIEMPYIVLAYDSSKDKISKVKSLFKYLHPCGCTPEGLAFGAIMDLFTEASVDEEDRYFLNISDGEPFFSMTSPITNQRFLYADGNGVEHTKNQVNKIRRKGIHILSYYVQNADLPDMGEHNTKKNFQHMYGRDAKFIKTDSIVELANTINELFLQRE